MLRRLLQELSRPADATLFAEAAALRKSGQLDEAERALRGVLAKAPNSARAHIHLGIVLAELGRMAEATALFARAVAIDPGDPFAHVNLANAHRRTGASDDALRHYRMAVRLQPDLPLAWSNMLRPSLDACDWDGAQRGLEIILQLRQRGERDWPRYIAPMDSLLLPLPAVTRREIADYHAGQLLADRVAPPRRSASRPHARLRIAYLSRDFRDHAVGQLVRALFSLHDRTRFELFAYSYGRDDDSRYRREIAVGADRFVDVRAESPANTAARIAGDGIDILVDLGGYTTDHRLATLAGRPAPIQVHYLGYPGTLGSGLADYYITDHIASPPGQDAQFAEHLVRLPSSFMVNDPDQPLADAPPSRSECGLQAGKIVLCAFHQTAKITQEVFDAWCGILRAVPDSVLWLKLPGKEARDRLARGARQRGVDPDRLVYAPDVACKRDHVARMAAGDVFLDTFGRYNGHSTVNEALWAALPVVTIAGEPFASRVAASLLNAAGIPELAAGTAEEYVRLAVSLARDASRREALRRRLVAARATAPLFDTAGTVRALESAYQAMWELHDAGTAPRAFSLRGASV